MYETFVMEIRPRLQSCNVFIILKNSDEISIKLQEKQIVIRAKNASESIETNFNILINTLSNLQVTKNFVTFRFQTQNIDKTAGKFETELLLLPENKTEALFKQQLVNNVSYIIKCNNCANNLTDATIFDRILPLPSENVQPDDWFCHKEENTVLQLSPKQRDCFYSNCYVHLNTNLLNNYKTKKTIIVCGRCFSWLGCSLKSNTIQLWFNTVIFQSENNKITSDPLEDFTSSIKNEIKDILIGPNKILFETSNFGSEYLLIWILEKNLQLKINNSTFKDKLFNVAKVLYLFNTEITNNVSDWLNDPNVSHIKISKPMMVHGLNHLYEMGNLIPNCFRKSNNFYVSYIII